jgi:hypothetical protein
MRAFQLILIRLRRLFAALLALIATRFLLVRARKSSAPLVVVCGEYGRLGNALVRFGHCITASRRLGFPTLDFSVGRYAELFPKLTDEPICGYPSQEMRLPRSRLARRFYALIGQSLVRLPRGWLRPRGVEVISLAHYDFDEADAQGDTSNFGRDRCLDFSGARFQEASCSNRLVILHGWRIRDYQGFLAEADFVREYLRPDARLTAPVDQELETMRAAGRVLIGLHMRGTDFKDWLGGRFFLTKADYRKRMLEMRRIFGENIAFFIASDESPDPDAWQDIAPVLWRSRSPIQDMHGLSRCDYIAGPPSTFSGWAAFAGQKPLCWIRPAGRETSPTHVLLYEHRGPEITAADFRPVADWRGVEIRFNSGSQFVL